VDAVDVADADDGWAVAGGKFGQATEDLHG
jgi:hypothetical protein